MLTNTWACCLCGSLLLTLGCRAERPASDTAALAALGNYRPYQARLTSELGYALCAAESLTEGAADCSGELPGVVPLRRWRCSPRPHPQSPAFKLLAKASRGVFERAVREEASAPELLKGANLQLLWQGDERSVKQAAAWLRRGLEIASDRQPFLADLGAVHLVLAERSGRTEDLLRSLEYSERALAERPDAAGPRYNLALALSQLGLSGAAEAEWQRFLARKPPALWAAEARSWLASLPAIEGEPLFAAAKPDHQLTREWIERDLLPQWAKAKLDGNEETAARVLAGAKVLASDLAAATGDHLLAEAIAAIANAPPSQQMKSAHGHRDFGEGLRQLYEEWSPASAHHLFTEAQEQFRSRSPFILWARFNSALTLNYRQRFAVAEAALAGLEGDTDAARYPALLGRIHWIRGLATSAQDKVEESNFHYHEATAIFCRLGENQNLAATQGLLAAGMSKLGHHEAAWTLTRSALARRGSIFQPLRLQAILHDAVNNAYRQRLLRAGLYFADEWVAVAEREGSARKRAESLPNALMRRAAIRKALGLSSEARADLDRAVHEEQSLASPELRGRADADRSLEQARGLLDDDPAAAVELLNGAIAMYRASGNLQKLPQAYGLRAQGLLAQQLVERAERDLNEEARLLGITISAIGPGPLRQDRITVLQDSFDRMVEFQAMVRRDARAAFRFSEQQRHWALWEWARSAAPGTRGSRTVADPLTTASWADLQAIQGDDTATVIYHALPNRVLLWANGPRGRTLATVAVGREELRSRVATLLAAARRRDMVTLIPSAETLYKILIASVAAPIRDASRLVIVPGPVLQDLPFGLLRDSGSGHYLYENHVLVFSPSATAYRRLERFKKNPGKSIHHLLAVFATQGDKPTLLPLPETAKEARAVASEWDGGRALSFREAAPLLRQLALADMFHFAGHAVSTPDSLRLVFHDDAVRPLQLTAANILREGFPRLRLVSLSGCRTVDVGLAGQIGSFSAGFVRSFLAAGVPTVVASFLDLDDRRARDVFPAFYRRLARGEDPAQAIHRACLEQPIRDRDEHALLCGSLAVYGISPPVAGKISAKVRLPRHN